MKYPDKIWLIPSSGSENETTWCDCPDPGMDNPGRDSEGYISMARYREVVRQRDEYKKLWINLMEAVNKACGGEYKWK